MIATADYLIVGSGLTGATIARVLSDAGREVVVLDRRDHPGGNVHDEVHHTGIRIHSYGPHYFRTNSEKIWDFVLRFSPFYKYEASLKSFVDGEYENWPIAASYIRRKIGGTWTPEFHGIPTNFEEASLAMMPRLVYEKFVKGYTEKQWGVPARSLDVSLAKRFDVREDDEPRLMRHRFQGIPERGYTGLMTNMLWGIPAILKCDFLKQRHDFRARKLLIFTGPIDEFFDFDLGKLDYRGQNRQHTYHPEAMFIQPCGQVNNPSPDSGPHIRTLEWKHMMPETVAAKITGTVLTKEVAISPIDPDRYEYPFPDARNANLYGKYRDRVSTLEDVLVCGRLGDYRYYDMDQAIGKAMTIASSLVDSACGRVR